MDIDIQQISNTILEQYKVIDPGYSVIGRVLQTVAILVGLVVLRSGLQRLLVGRFRNPDTNYTWQKWVRYTCDALAILLIVNIWFSSGQEFATYLGLLSAGIAIALQDPIASLFAWIYIAYVDPFDVGDRVQIGDFKGDVVDIQPLEFTLQEVSGKWVDADQSTGRFIHLPNRMLFREALSNETQYWPFVWQEIPVIITFESDWERAKRLLEEIMNDHVADVVDAAEVYIKRKPADKNIRIGRTTPIVYTAVEVNGIELTMRFLCESKYRRARTQAIWESFLRQLPHEKKIHLAHTTRRVITTPPAENVLG